MLLAQVLDPEARPVRKSLRSLVGSCVEVAADAAVVSDQRNRRRSRVGLNRPPGARIGDWRRDGRKPGELPTVRWAPRMQPAKGGRLLIVARVCVSSAARDAEDRGDG